MLSVFTKSTCLDVGGGKLSMSKSNYPFDKLCLDRESPPCSHHQLLSRICGAAEDERCMFAIPVQIFAGKARWLPSVAHLIESM